MGFGAMGRSYHHPNPYPQSPHLGVYWASDKGKWAVYVRNNGVQKNCGYCEADDEAGAGRAYDERATQLLPKAARTLNFLPDGSLNPGRLKGLTQLR